MQTISHFIVSIIDLINNVFVPLLFAVAFMVFLFGVFRYFIAGADNKEKRQNGVQVITYSIIGFVLMISVWGIVNLFVHTLGFNSNVRPCLPTFGKDTDCSDATGGGYVPAQTAPGSDFLSPDTKDYIQQQAELESKQ